MDQPRVEFIPVASQPIARWKNGGGRTREVAVARHETGEGFRWRVSVAEVASDGPFSLFPGIDRTLWLLRGKGMAIDVDGVEHWLDVPLVPFAFRGEAKVSARLIDGPTEDLNVMVERATTHADARVIRCGPTLEVPAADGDALLLVLDGECDVREGPHATHRIGAGDALLWRGSAPALRPCEASGPAVVLFARFARR
ncbi:MAG: HutD family protein [Planctomycetes bacterium]|nr:HutD family protein [Planctomycetota bacterium]